MTRLIEQVSALTKVITILAERSLDVSPAFEEVTEVLEEVQVDEIVEEADEVEEAEVVEEEVEEGDPANRKSTGVQPDFESLEEAEVADKQALPDFRTGLRRHFGLDKEIE